MDTHEFVMTVEHPDLPATGSPDTPTFGALVDRLHDAGFGDSLIVHSGGRLTIDVSREAPSRDEAVASARSQVKGMGGTVTSVVDGWEQA